MVLSEVGWCDGSGGGHGGGRRGWRVFLCECALDVRYVLFCDITGFVVSHLVEKCLQLRSKGC